MTTAMDAEEVKQPGETESASMKLFDIKFDHRTNTVILVLIDLFGNKNLARVLRFRPKIYFRLKDRDAYAKIEEAVNTLAGFTGDASLTRTEKPMQNLVGYDEPTVAYCIECTLSKYYTLIRFIETGRLHRSRDDDSDMDQALGTISNIKLDQQFYFVTKTYPCCWIYTTKSSNIIFNISDVKPDEHTKALPEIRGSFDLEVDNHFDNENRGFPSGKLGSRIQIIGLVITSLNPNFTPRNYCFSLQDINKPLGRGFENTTVFSFQNKENDLKKSERELIIKFIKTVKKEKISILQAHNGSGFDWEMIFDRVKYLKISEEFWGEFTILPKKGYDKCQMWASGEVVERSKLQMGVKRILKSLNLDVLGLTYYDTFEYSEKTFSSLESYKLDDLGMTFLGKPKYEMDYQELFRFYIGEPNEDELRKFGCKEEWRKEAIRETAEYCMMDCLLVDQLSDKWNMCATVNELASARYTNVRKYISTGEQIKTEAIIHQYCQEHNIFINSENLPSAPDYYQGATVLEPKVGLYTNPLASLDFASLYPSTIIAHNLDWSTILLKKGRLQTPDDLGIPEDMCECTELYQEVSFDSVADMEKYIQNNDISEKETELLFLAAEKQEKNTNAKQTFKISLSHTIVHRPWFVREQYRKGVAPAFLEYFGKLRKAVKKEMKQYKPGTIEHILLDKKQLAIKIIMNSTYGFFGVGDEFGILPCHWVAQVTTSRGRTCIDLTQKHVIEKFSKDALAIEPISYNGIDLIDVDIIYGDTDSVMVEVITSGNFETVENAYELLVFMFWILDYMAKYVSAKFKGQTLEGEEVKIPFCSFKKKKYCAMSYEPDNFTRENFCKWIEGNNSAISAHPLAKGTSSVRRDKPKIMSRIIDSVMKALSPKPPFSKDSILTNVSKIVQNFLQVFSCGIVGETPENQNATITLDDLSITKKIKNINKGSTDYSTPGGDISKVKIPQVQAALKKNHQIAIGAHNAEPKRGGDRVTYIMLNGHEGVSDRAFELDWYKQNQNDPDIQRPDLLHVFLMISKELKEILKLIGLNIDIDTLEEKLKQEKENSTKIICMRESGQKSLYNFIVKQESTSSKKPETAVAPVGLPNPRPQLIQKTLTGQKRIPETESKKPQKKVSKKDGLQQSKLSFSKKK